MARSPSKQQDPSSEAQVTPEVTEVKSTDSQVEAPKTQPTRKPRAVSELPHGAKIEDF